jgi:lipid-binding SYLF domain-containing protein
MHAEMLTYSRSRGIFAGISLQGATLRPDEDWNEEMYGKKLSNREIVLGPTAPPPGAHRFEETLNKYSGRRTK